MKCLFVFSCFAFLKSLHGGSTKRSKPARQDASERVTAFANLLLHLSAFSHPLQYQQHQTSALARKRASAHILGIRPSKPDDGAEKQKKRHMLLVFGFVGTDYYGLEALNLNSTTGQMAISDVLLSALLKAGFFLPSNFRTSRTKWTLASRTDKGVHGSFAAASVKIESYISDVIELPGNASSNPPLQPACVLSSQALERINAELPENIKVFWGTNVTKTFNARELASSRVYEYILPAELVGGNAAEFDKALRAFEGTHRFHNFAKGILPKNSSDVFHFGNMSWPTIKDLKHIRSQAFRSVITCRVARRVDIGGSEYLVVRIAGLAFAYNQIRRMIGAALAVAQGRVPLDILRISLDSPLRARIAPLAPGFPLLLSNISWFAVKPNQRGLDYTADIPERVYTATEAFKYDAIYTHIHELHKNGGFAEFLDELQTYFDVDGSYITYEAIDATRMPNAYFDDFHKAADAWRAHVSTLKLNRSNHVEKHREKKELPGGLYVEICKHFQVSPNPWVRHTMDLLRAKLERGELRPGEHYKYYIELIEAEHRDGKNDPGEGPHHIEAWKLRE